jgi:hypothetical protein
MAMSRGGITSLKTRDKGLWRKASNIDTFETCRPTLKMSASLIWRLRSSAFRLSASAVLMSLADSYFPSESAPGPSIMGF